MPKAKWLDLSYDIHDRYVAAQGEIHRLTGLLAEMDSQPVWDGMKADLLALRRLLWARHNADCAAILYGDDGEMSCGRCRIDFKRDAVTTIEGVFVAQGLAALTERD